MSTSIRWRLPSLILLASLVFAAGCGGGGPDLQSVGGVVTLDGAPLPGVKVVFQPESGRPSSAITDAQGRFSLEFTAGKEGAMTGKQSVFLESVEPDDDEEGAAEPVAFPDKYKQVFETVEVVSGENEFTFELTSE